MNSYTLDQTAAKQADSINSRIERSDKYLGMFTRAEPTTSKKGAKGVDLSFKADSGESADYLTLWTHNGEGKQLMGFNTLMAIMTCLRVKSLNAEEGVIEKYVKASGKREKVTVPLFKELMNKPISLLIQMEESEYEGKTSWKPVIFGVCDAKDFTASEILNKSTSAEIVHKMMTVLKDKPMKGGTIASKESHESGHVGQSFSNEVDPFADDIEF